LNFEGKSVFTDTIDKELDLLKGNTKTYSSIVSIINEKYKTSFNKHHIIYRIQKLCQETKGKAQQDAYEFVKLAEEDVKTNSGFFAYSLNENNQFDKCVYLSNVMLLYSQHFLDIIIVDSTYRRNRFNLALVNVLGINNHGQSIILAFGLLSAETKENYIWLFSQIKSAWKKTPQTCISDDDESIQQGKYIDFGCFIYIGLSSNFKSTLLLCSWHVQRNLISKFCYISKTNPELYKKITNLPFITNQANFEEIIDTLRSSNDIPKEQIQYLDKKLEKKNGQNVLQKKNSLEV